MTDELRTLEEADRAALEAFLASRPSTTMILRSNLAAAGFTDEGRPLEGTYVGAFDDARALVGVAGSFWNGNVVLEADRDQARLVRAASEASGREVRGLLGAASQVEAATAAIDRAAFTFDSREILFELDLAALQVPPALESGEVVARHPRADEDDLLVAWRLDFVLEAIGAPRSAESEASAREWIVRARERGQSWVLEVAGALVSFTGFNAAVPDSVQVGGVWTPRSLRGRGHARAVVAASLLEARAGGAVRAFLFTDEANVAAQRCYAGLGFEVVGDYRILLRLDDGD